MAETLIQRIKRIEDNPNYYIDADAEMRKAFEVYAKNSIVRSVMEGRTTFSQSYENLLGNYDSWRALLPTLTPEGFEQNIADLASCIGESPVDSRWDTKLENPLGMAGVFGTSGVLLSALDRGYAKKKEVSRRDFLIVAGAFFGMVGTVGGLTLSYTRHQDLEALNQNAIHLDNIHTRLYSR